MGTVEGQCQRSPLLLTSGIEFGAKGSRKRECEEGNERKRQRGRERKGLGRKKGVSS